MFRGRSCVNSAISVTRPLLAQQNQFPDVRCNLQSSFEEIKQSTENFPYDWASWWNHRWKRENQSVLNLRAERRIAPWAAIKFQSNENLRDFPFVSRNAAVYIWMWMKQELLCVVKHVEAESNPPSKHYISVHHQSTNGAAKRVMEEFIQERQNHNKRAFTALENFIGISTTTSKQHKTHFVRLKQRHSHHDSSRFTAMKMKKQIRNHLFISSFSYLLK